MKTFTLVFQLSLIVLGVFIVAVMVSVANHYRGVPATFLPAEPTSEQSVQSGPQDSPPPSRSAADQAKFASHVVNFRLVKTLTAGDIASAQNSFLHTTLPTQVSEIKVYELQYTIIDKDGVWRPIKAQVFVPTSLDGNSPLFVFGSGTTGLADKCAPSLENVAVDNLGNYFNHMTTQAAADYVAVFPDYEGFNDLTATQAYFISESEAKVLLGSIRSLLELRSSYPDLASLNPGQIFLSGYSQGGHAALSAAQHWSTLPNSAQLLGIVQYAGAADVTALFQESPHLTSYLAESFISYYPGRLKAADVMRSDWVEGMILNNANLCVNQAWRFYPKSLTEVYRPEFAQALVTNTWSGTAALWHELMVLNTPLTDLPLVPQLLIQGEVDPIVTAKTQKKNAATLCQITPEIWYSEYQGVNHFQIRQAGFTESLQWMEALLAGQSPKGNCQLWEP